MTEQREQRKEVPDWPGYFLSSDGILWQQGEHGMRRVSPSAGKYTLRDLSPTHRRAWTVSPAALLAAVFPPAAPAKRGRRSEAAGVQPGDVVEA